MTATQMEAEGFFTIREVAAFYRVSKWTVNRELNAGRWTRVKFGRAVRIPAAEVLAEVRALVR